PVSHEYPRSYLPYLIFFHLPITVEIFYCHYFLFIKPSPPSSTLFPYTTLFRSHRSQRPYAADAPQLSKYHGKPREPDRRGFESRSEEHTSELQSRFDLVCRLLLEKKKKKTICTSTSSNTTFSCALYYERDTARN